MSSTDFEDRVPDELVDGDGWGPAGRALAAAYGWAGPSPKSGVGQAGARSASAPARAFKQGNVTRAVRAAQAAGIEVGSITVNSVTGKIMITAATSGAAVNAPPNGADKNEWDVVLTEANKR